MSLRWQNKNRPREAAEAGRKVRSTLSRISPARQQPAAKRSERTGRSAKAFSRVSPSARNPTAKRSERTGRSAKLRAASLWQENNRPRSGRNGPGGPLLHTRISPARQQPAGEAGGTDRRSAETSSCVFYRQETRRRSRRNGPGGPLYPVPNPPGKTINRRRSRRNGPKVLLSLSVSHKTRTFCNGLVPCDFG